MTNELTKSLNKANRKQLEDFIVDCLGYDDVEDLSCAYMREAILEFELADKQGDQFAGYTF
jgi:hypothetical protein